MLGKRFRRTTSMSQLGPGCNHASAQKSDKKAQGIQDSCVPHKAARPLMIQGNTPSAGIEGCGGDDTDRGGDANMVMPHAIDASHDVKISLLQAHEDIPPFLVHPTSPLVPYQMGLWTQQDLGFGHHLGSGKMHHVCAEAGISPVGFLDVCFFCKRRLRHERDIFIYRGDSAFCSEECRHRQILSDERRTLRGAVAA